MGYKVKPYIGISKKAKPRFESLGGESWLMLCYDRYNNGETLVEIAKDFGLPHTYIYERFLDFRLPTEKYSQNIPNSVLDSITELWDLGYNSRDISEKLSLDYKSVLSVLKRLGFDTSTGITKKRELGVNKNFFKIPSEERSYFYGLLLTDGNISEDGVVDIKLKSTDRHILDTFNSAANLNAKVKDFSKFDNRTNKTYYASRLCFKIKSISDDLFNLGLSPRKSMKEECPPEFMVDRHFWRGVIDGDGHVSNRRKLISLCGSKVLCSQFKLFCEYILESSLNQKICKGSTEGLYTFTITGDKSVQVMKALYEDSTVYINRKFESAKSHFRANDNNPDNVRSRLTTIRLCDETGSFYNDPFSICDCQG